MDVAAVIGEIHSRRVGALGSRANACRAEVERPAGGHSRVDQVFDDFVLSVNGDPPSAREPGHVHAMAATRKRQVDPFMAKALAIEARGHTGRPHEIDGALFEDAGADALDDMVAATIFDDDRIDAMAV